MQLTNIEHPKQGLLAAQTALEILVFDDDDFDLTRLQRLLQKVDKKVEVHACSSVEQMNNVLDHQVIDLCLLDLRLGDLDGCDVMRSLRRRPDSAELPVVMVSGMQDTESVVRTIKAGCTDFLEKDHLTADKLRQTIFQALTSSMPDPDLTYRLHEASEAVVKGIAKGCIAELQPRLRQIYRQVSFIRNCHNMGLLPDPQALDKIEQNCLAVWRFFDEVEAYADGFSKPVH